MQKNQSVRGEIVVIWAITEYYKTKEEAEEAAVDGKIYTQFDENLFVMVDTTKRSVDPTHYMNHSCDSNVWMKDEVTLIARREINCDEEITIDYALFESTNDWVPSWNCSCDSTLCRGKFTGKDWMMPEIQEKYKGHFSPWNNKRIKRFRERIEKKE